MAVRNEPYKRNWNNREWSLSRNLPIWAGRGGLWRKRSAHHYRSRPATVSLTAVSLRLTPRRGGRRPGRRSRPVARRSTCPSMLFSIARSRQPRSAHGSGGAGEARAARRPDSLSRAGGLPRCGRGIAEFAIRPGCGRLPGVRGVRCKAFRGRSRAAMVNQCFPRPSKSCHLCNSNGA